MSYLVNILTFDATPPRAAATPGGHCVASVFVNIRVEMTTGFIIVFFMNSSTAQ